MAYQSQQSLFGRVQDAVNADFAARATEVTWESLGAAEVTDSQANRDGRLNTSEVLRFILAGNATFTVKSVRTGTRYTYKVRLGEPNAAYPGQAWFVKALTGSDNTSDYSYMGMIRDRQYRMTRGSRLSATSPAAVAFAWLFGRLVANQGVTGVEVYHAGKCGRCGRLLTVPESVASGFGPECIGKLGVA